jgi:micrococcal nuclease
VLLLLIALVWAVGTMVRQNEQTAKKQAETARDHARDARKSVPAARPSGKLVAVDPTRIKVDDGDTVEIDWPDGSQEIVRILGIDTPETRHPEHNIPQDQPYGREARAFGQGAFAAATEVELERAAKPDQYGRTLGYLFINKQNYSLLVLKARLAYETVSHYGDNGFPEEAAAIRDAARALGNPSFEPPWKFRSRMREEAQSKGERPPQGKGEGRARPR